MMYRGRSFPAETDDLPRSVRATDLDCLKMSLHCTTAYHLHIDGQSMRTLQVLEVMLRDCVLNWGKVLTGMWYTVMLNEPSTVNG